MATETPWISISRPNAGRLVLAEPSLVEADARLVQPGEHLGRVGVHPVRAGPLQLLAAVAAGLEADAERPGAARREQVPHAVPHHHRVPRLDAEQRGG